MRKPKRKRFAAILLSIAVAISMLPLGFAAETAQAADPTIATDGIMLKVGGVEVTDANKNNILADVTGATGTASYDPGTRTLTLNGATIPMGFLFDSNDGTLIRYGGIYAELDDWNSDASLNIVLVGNNTITGIQQPANHGLYGIWSEPDLTISGEGQLIVSAEQMPGEERMDINGIYALKSLSITGTNIHANLSTIDQGAFKEKSLIGIRAEDGIVMDNATFNCRTLAPDTRGQGISCAGSITIKNGSYVDISVAGRENKPAYSLCGISVPTDSASAKIMIRDSKVSVETGASGGEFYHNYGIRGAVDIQGSSVVDAHAGETLSSGLNSFGMFAYTANDTNPLYTTPLKISDTSVVTVSGHTACLYTSSSQFDLNNFPNLRDHAFADAGKALVSTNVTGEGASPWEPYYQEPGASNYEGDYINAFKYARFPQYLESDLAKISIRDPGGDGALITQNSFHVPKGTSMDNVMRDARRYFKDGNESGYYYEYDSSDPDEGIFCALVNEKTNQTIYIGFARTYTNIQAWYDDLAAKINGKTAEGDIVLYLIREKTVTDTGVVVDIPSPAPGTDSYTNPPKFINHSKQLIAYSIAHMAGPDCWWIADPNSPSGIGYSPYDGPIEAGKDYYTLFMAIPEFGWYVPKGKSIPATVRGGTVVEILQPQNMSLYIVKVRAGMGNNQIAADTVAETLNKLPAASSITLAHANAVKAARAAYNKLSADAKKLVDPTALKKLTEAEAKIAKLKAKATYDKNVKAAKSYKVKGLKVKALKKRKATVTWTKYSKATGYQIQYAMNTKFKKAKKKTIKGASKKKATLSILKAGKTYYVRIRTYKALKNPATGKTTKIYGKWSTAKRIKAKM